MLHSSVDTEGMFIIAASLFRDGWCSLYQSFEIYTNQRHNIQLLPKFKKCPVIGDWVLLKQMVRSQLGYSLFTKDQPL